MSEQIELIYNRLVAQEKLKSGTPYERLAAIVFSLLTEQTTVHDMKLRGDSEVAHQIDVTVGEGDNRKHILIECKDYTTGPVGLDEMRSFWAVVEDLKPDAAYFVTTGRFTGPAAKFAAAKGVTAAVLRPPRDEDWEGILRRIELTISMLVPLSDPRVEWLADPSVSTSEVASAPKGMARTEDLLLLDAAGNSRSAKNELDRILSPPLDFEGTYSGIHRFDETTLLQVGAADPLKVTGFKFTQEWGHATQEVVVSDGVPGLTAELVLRSLDGSIHRMFSDGELQQWTLADDGRVIPREAKASNDG